MSFLFQQQEAVTEPYGMWKLRKVYENTVAL